MTSRIYDEISTATGVVVEKKKTLRGEHNKPKTHFVEYCGVRMSREEALSMGINMSRCVDVHPEPTNVRCVEIDPNKIPAVRGSHSHTGVGAPYVDYASLAVAKTFRYHTKKYDMLPSANTVLLWQRLHYCLESKIMKGPMTMRSFVVFGREYVTYKWDKFPNLVGLLSECACDVALHTFKKGQPTNARAEEEHSLRVYTKRYVDLKRDVDNELSRAMSAVTLRDPRSVAKEMKRVVTVAVRAEKILKRGKDVARQRKRDAKAAKTELHSYGTVAAAIVGSGAALFLAKKKVASAVAGLSTLTQSTIELIVHLASFVYGFTAEFNSAAAVHFTSFILKLKDYYLRVAPAKWTCDWDGLQSTIVSSLRKAMRSVGVTGEVQTHSGLKTTVDVLDFLRKNYTRVVESELVKIFKTTVKYVLCILYGSIAGVKTWSAGVRGITFWRIDYSTVDITDLGKFILDTLHFLGDRLDKLVDLGNEGKIGDSEEVLSAVFDPNPDLQKLGVEHAELSHLVSQYSVMSCEDWVALVGCAELQACHSMLLGRLTKLINAVTALSATKKSDTHYVTVCIRLLRDAQATYGAAAFNSSRSTLRKAPFTVYVSGPTGVGKSTLTHQIITALLADHMPEGQPVDASLFGKLTDQNFDNDLDSRHLAVTVDDLFQSTRLEDNQAMAMKIFQLQNNMTSTLNRAAIEEKGRTVCNPLVILATANADRVPKNIVVSTRALARRFHYYVRIGVRDEFKTPNGMVDSKKIAELPDEAKSQAVHIVARVEDVVFLDASSGQGEDYKFKQVYPATGGETLAKCLRFLNARMTQHLAQQTELVKNLTNPHYGACPHHKHIWTCRQCHFSEYEREELFPIYDRNAIFERHIAFLRGGDRIEGESDEARNIRLMAAAEIAADEEIRQLIEERNNDHLEDILDREASELDDDDSSNVAEDSEEYKDGLFENHTVVLHSQKRRRPDTKKRKKAAAAARLAAMLQRAELMGVNDPGDILYDPEFVARVAELSDSRPFVPKPRESVVSKAFTAVSRRWKAFMGAEEIMVRKAVCAFALAGAAGALYYHMRKPAIKAAEVIVKDTGLDKKVDGVILHTLERYIEPSLFSSVDKNANVSLADFESGVRAMLVTLTVTVNDGFDQVLHGVNGGYVLPGPQGSMHIYTSAHFNVSVPFGTLYVECTQFSRKLAFSCDTLTSIDLGCDTRRLELKGPNVKRLNYYFAPGSRVWRSTIEHADLRHLGRPLVVVGDDKEVRGHGIVPASRDEGIMAIRHALAHYASGGYQPPLASDLIVTKGGVWTRPLRSGDCGGVLYANIPGVSGGCAILGMYVARFTSPWGACYNIYAKNPSFETRLMTAALRDRLYVDNVNLLRKGAVSNFCLGNFAKVCRTWKVCALPFKPNTMETGVTTSYSLNRLVCYGAPKGNAIPVQSFSTSVHKRPGFISNEELLGLTDHKAPSVGKGPGQSSVPECNMKAVRAFAYNGMVTFDENGVQTFGGENVAMCVPVVVEKASIDRAYESIRDMLFNVLRHCSHMETIFSALPAHNVLCGIRESIPRLNSRSSSGFAGEERVGRIGQEIANVFEEREGRFYYKDHVEPLLEDMEKRAVDCDLEYVTRVLLKHEPLGVAKKYARTFYASPLVWQILLRRRLGKLYAAITADPLRSELSIGIDPVSADWETLCDHLRMGDPGWSKFGGDFASFDMMMPSEVLTPVVNSVFDACIAAGANRLETELARSIMTCVVNPTYLILGEVYKMKGSHPSGYLWTVLINGLAVSFLLRQEFYDRSIELGHNLRFEDHVRVVTGGDDHVVSVSSVAREFGLLDACRFGARVRSYGWNYTDPNKLPYSVPFSDERDIDFLKRSFGTFQGHRCGLLAKKSIKKSLLWGVDSAEAMNVVLSGVIMSVMREATTQGEDYYELILSACRNMVNDCVPTEVVTCHHLIDEVYSGRYQSRVDDLVQVKFAQPSERFTKRGELELRGRIDELLSQLPVYLEEGTLHGGEVFTSGVSRAISSHEGGCMTELHTLIPSVSEIQQPNILSGVPETKEVDTSEVLDAVAPVYNVHDDVYGVVGAVEAPMTIANREFYAGEWEINLGTAFNGISVDLPALWRQSLVNTTVNIPFKYVMEMEARIVVSAHQFHTGLLCAYMHPCPGHDPLFVRPGTTAPVFYDRSVAYQYPHVEIDLCRSGEYVLKCKVLLNELEPIPAVLSAWNWHEGGSVHIVPITAIHDASAATGTSPRIAVFGRATRVLFEGKTELNTYTPIGDRLANLAKQRFGLAGASATAVDAVGGALSRALGFSMPWSNAPVGVIPAPRVYGTTNGNEAGLASAASMTDGLGKPVDTVDVGDMEILSIAKKEGLIGVFALRREVKDMMVQLAVQPFSNLEEDDVHTLTPLGYLSMVFRRWRGSLKYRFKIVAPSTAVGVVSIVVDPLTGPLSREPRPDLRTTYDIDLSVTREMEVCVPWHNTKHVLETYPAHKMLSHISRTSYIKAYEHVGPVLIPLGQQYPECNGVLTVMTTTRISYPIVGNTIPDCYVVITCSSDDIEFFDPFTQCAGGYGFDLQSLVADPSSRIVVGCDGVKGQSVDSSRIGLEKITSVKQLLMRYMLHTVNNYAATTPSGTNQEVTITNCWPVRGLPYGVVQSTSPWYEWFESGGTSSKKSGTLMHYLHWFRPLFYCASGGMRYRAVVSGQSSFPSSISGRWLGVGSSANLINDVESRITYEFTGNGNTPFIDVDIDRKCGGGSSFEGCFEPDGSMGIVMGVDGGTAVAFFPDRSGKPFTYAREAHVFPGTAYCRNHPHEMVASVIKYRPGVAAAAVTYTRERVHLACGDDYVLGTFACVPRLYEGPYGLTN